MDELYIHHDERDSRSESWVVNTAGVWVTVRAGDKQPSNSLRRLTFQRHGDPSWVMKDTYAVYRSRMRRKGRLTHTSTSRVSLHKPTFYGATVLLTCALLAICAGLNFPVSQGLLSDFPSLYSSAFDWSFVYVLHVCL